MLAILVALSLKLSLPVFGPGPVTNLGCYPHWADRDCDAAWTNAAAHVGWALAIPLLGEKVGGRRGLWIAGGAWVAASLVQESLFHGGQAPEVRTDLLSRIVPTLLVLGIDLAVRR